MPCLRDGSYFNPMDAITEVSFSMQEEDKNTIGDILVPPDTNRYIRSALIDALLIEVKRGVDKYGSFIDMDQFHQALKEEVEELYDEFEAETIDLVKVWKEAMQVAAVTIRGIEEIERRTLG